MNLRSLRNLNARDLSKERAHVMNCKGHSYSCSRVSEGNFLSKLDTANHPLHPIIGVNCEEQFVFMR